MLADEVARRYVDAVNGRDAAAFAALFAPDAVVHDPFFPEPTKGRDAVRSMIEGVLGAFPDLTWEQVGDPIAAGDRAAVVVTVRGTNDGPLPLPTGELPPTGEPISYETAVLWRIAPDGLIAEERSYFDATGVAVQLGLTR